MNYVERLASRIREELPAEAIPEEEADSLFLLYALLALRDGIDVTPDAVHDAWSTWMTARGLGDHESVKPFGSLDVQTQALDKPYVEAIRRAASTAR